MTSGTFYKGICFDKIYLDAPLQAKNVEECKIKMIVRHKDLKTLHCAGHLGWEASSFPLDPFIAGVASIISQLCEEGNISKEEIYKKLDRHFE